MLLSGTLMALAGLSSNSPDRATLETAAWFKKPAALGQAANSALAALGTAVCKLLGLSNAVGMGIAVLIITNAAWIGKVVLCRMTSPEELAKYFG
jgi:hypothetical protein